MSRRRRRRNYGWVQAKDLLEQALRTRFGESTPIEIGRVSYLGKGLCRRAFIGDVEVSGNPEWSRNYIILRPLAQPDPECDQGTRREAKVLRSLAEANLPFRVPELVAAVEDAGRPAIVETSVAGFPLDLRAGRQGQGLQAGWP